MSTSLNVPIPRDLIETENIIENVHYYEEFEFLLQKSKYVTFTYIYQYFINYKNIFIFVSFLLLNLKELSVELNSDFDPDDPDSLALKNVSIPKSLIFD